jgi:hypothetical protein
MMEGIDDILANLDAIQKNIGSSNNSADIASVQYVCKNIDEYNRSTDKNTKIMVKSLNILHDSILLLPPQTKDEGYLQSVVNGILKCIYVTDLYRMVDAVVLELSEDKKISEIIKREINVFLSVSEVPDDVKTRFHSLLLKVMKKNPVEEPQEFGNMNLKATNLSLNESPRPQNDMLMIKSLPSRSTDGPGASFTPRLLNISFLPQSLTEQWALAKSAEEVWKYVLKRAYIYFLSFTIIIMHSCSLSLELIVGIHGS